MASLLSRLKDILYRAIYAALFLSALFISSFNISSSHPLFRFLTRSIAITKLIMAIIIVVYETHRSRGRFFFYLIILLRHKRGCVNNWLLVFSIFGKNCFIISKKIRNDLQSHSSVHTCID